MAAARCSGERLLSTTLAIAAAATAILLALLLFFDASADATWALALLAVAQVCPCLELVWLHYALALSTTRSTPDIESGLSHSLDINIGAEISNPSPSSISIVPQPSTVKPKLSDASVSQPLNSSHDIHKNLPDLPQEPFPQSMLLSSELTEPPEPPELSLDPEIDPTNAFVLPDLLISFKYSLDTETPQPALISVTTTAISTTATISSAKSTTLFSSSAPTPSFSRHVVSELDSSQQQKSGQYINNISNNINNGSYGTNSLIIDGASGRVTGGMADSFFADLKEEEDEQPPPQPQQRLSSNSSFIKSEILQRNVENIPSESVLIHNQSITAAIQLMWNGEFGKAGVLLTGVKEEGKVACCVRDLLHLSELRFLIQLTSGCEEDILAVLKQVKQSETLCLRVLGSSDELVRSFDSLRFESFLGPNAFLRDGFYKLFKLDTECCYADTLLLKGCFQILMGREIKGTSTLRSSWKVYQKLEKELSLIDYSNHRDIVSLEEINVLEIERRNLEHSVKYGLAFFHILVDIVPTALSTILKTIGFTSNKPLALKLLNTIIASDSIRAPMARFVVLVDAASFLTPVGVLRIRKWADDPIVATAALGIDELFTEAGHVSRGVVDTVSPIFNMLGYYMHFKMGEIDKASLHLTKAIEFTPKDVVPYPAALWFETGCQLVLK
ncbi:UNVERIFIED_CONTAM: hypothetical protein HDU68_008881 [Siphonaria sp. JEL0065]|nr:hypothetical protein HDU68_008881 [Siphonaria sp. JEL0065]